MLILLDKARISNVQKDMTKHSNWSVEQEKIMDHFDDFTGGEKNLFASYRYIFGQNTPNDY